jgi:hypothetical protein
MPEMITRFPERGENGRAGVFSYVNREFINELPQAAAFAVISASVNPNPRWNEIRTLRPERS